MLSNNMFKKIAIAAFALIALTSVANAATADQNASAVAVASVYINTCDTPLSDFNQSIFAKLKADRSYSYDQLADQIVLTQNIIAKVGKTTWCDATTKMFNSFDK